MLRCIVSPTVALMPGGVYKNCREQRRQYHPYSGLMYPGDVENRINKNNKKQMKKGNANPKNKQQNKKKGKAGYDRTKRMDKLVNDIYAIDLAKSPVAPKPRIPKVRPTMSKCAWKYALAVCDPFAPAARGACIPSGSASSHKVHAFLRFDVTIGTAGTAIVQICPSLAGNLPSLFYTNASWPGTSNQPFASNGTLGTTSPLASTFSTGWSEGTANLPYIAHTLYGNAINGGVGSPIIGKIVSAGLRAQYTGTVMNMSGLQYCYHDPAHESTSGLTVARIGNFADSDVKGTSHMTCTTTVFGVEDSEMQFPEGDLDLNGIGSTSVNYTYPYSQNNYWANVYSDTTITTGVAVVATGVGLTGVPIGNPIAVMGFTGVAGQTIHCEYIVHAEYTGMLASSMATPVSADPQSAAMVRTAALALPAAKFDQPEKDGWSLFYDVLSDVWAAAKPIAIPAGQAALSALLL